MSRRRLPAWLVWTIRAALLAVVVTALVYSPRGVMTVVAGILIAAVVIYWWLRRKFKKLIGPLADMDFFPDRIQLQLQKRAAWTHEEEASRQESALLELGYKSLGRFTIDKTPGVLLGGFHGTSPPSFAVINDWEHLDVNLDFVCRFEDGSYLTCTSSSVTEVLERPPHMPIVRLPEADPHSLHERFVAEIGGRPVAPLTPDEFTSLYETYHAEHQAWQLENAEQNEQLERAIRESFLESAGWSAIEWDRKRERVVFVHDSLQKWIVAETYLDAHDFDDDLYDREEVRAKEVCAELPPRRAFAALLESAPGGSGVSKLLELSEPVPVDAYLEPEDS